MSACHRLPRPPSAVDLHRGYRPSLQIVVELEELPQVRLASATSEDEQRLHEWLAQPAVQARLREALADAIEELAA